MSKITCHQTINHAHYSFAIKRGGQKSVKLSVKSKAVKIMAMAFKWCYFRKKLFINQYIHQLFIHQHALLLLFLTLLPFLTYLSDDFLREQYQDSWQNCGCRKLPDRPKFWAGLSKTSLLFQWNVLILYIMGQHKIYLMN